MKLNQQKIEECAQWVRENGLVDYGGATKTAFCKAMSIDVETLRNWMKGNSEFSEAIKRAQQDYKSNLEFELVVSLGKAAKGYSYTKTKTEYKDKNGKPYISKRIEEKMDVQPNVGAAIFLLTNIAPERWKNKMSNEMDARVDSIIKADVDARYSFDGIADEDLFKMADIMQENRRKQVEKEKYGEEAGTERD